MAEYVPGMRDSYPDLCWRLNDDGTRCCIQERGHDHRIHEGDPLPHHEFDWTPCANASEHGWHPWQVWEGEYMKTVWCRGVEGD